MKKIMLFVFCVAAVFGFYRIADADLNEGLFAHYQFDGDALDTSGNRYDGVINGDVRFVDGLFGLAAKFGGTDYITVPYQPEIEPSEFSVSLWINTIMDPFESLNEGYIISSSQNMSGCNHGYNLHIETDGIVVFWIEDNNGCGDFTYIASTTPVNDGEWHHIVLIYDSNRKMKLYIDGIEQPSGATAIFKGGYQKSNQPIKLGMHPDSKGLMYNTFFEGNLDQLRLYNRPLSETEVQQLFKEELFKEEPSTESPYTIAGITLKRFLINYQNEANSDKYLIRGKFDLAYNSDGINPVEEKVILEVGSSRIIIPENSFTRNNSGVFILKEIINGIKLGIKLKERKGQVIFNAAVRGVDLSESMNPINVLVAVGDDRGVTEAKLEGALSLEARKWRGKWVPKKWEKIWDLKKLKKRWEAEKKKEKWNAKKKEKEWYKKTKRKKNKNDDDDDDDDDDKDDD